MLERFAKIISHLLPTLVNSKLSRAVFFLFVLFFFSGCASVPPQTCPSPPRVPDYPPFYRAPPTGRLNSRQQCGSAISTCPTAPPNPPGHKIRLVGSPTEQAKFQQWLNQLRQTPSGRNLLSAIDQSISRTGNDVVILVDIAGVTSAMAAGVPNRNRTLAYNGTGINSTIVVNPDIANGVKNAYGYDVNGNQVHIPVDVALFHEMVHSLDQINGTLDPTKACSEYKAIAWANLYRQERNQLSPSLPSIQFRDPNNHRGIIR